MNTNKTNANGNLDPMETAIAIMNGEISPEEASAATISDWAKPDLIRGCSAVGAYLAGRINWDYDPDVIVMTALKNGKLSPKALLKALNHFTSGYLQCYNVVYGEDIAASEELREQVEENIPKILCWVRGYLASLSAKQFAHMPEIAFYLCADVLRKYGEENELEKSLSYVVGLLKKDEPNARALVSGMPQSLKLFLESC